MSKPRVYIKHSFSRKEKIEMLEQLIAYAEDKKAEFITEQGFLKIGHSKHYSYLIWKDKLNSWVTVTASSLDTLFPSKMQSAQFKTEGMEATIVRELDIYFKGFDQLVREIKKKTRLLYKFRDELLLATPVTHKNRVVNDHSTHNQTTVNKGWNIGGQIGNKNTKKIEESFWSKILSVLGGLLGVLWGK